MIEEKRENVEQRLKGKKHVFPGQLEREKVVFFARKHPLSFISMGLIALGMLVLPFIGIFLYGTTKIPLSGFAAQIFVAIIGAYILFSLGFFLVAWISYYYDVIIVTDFRIVEINQEALFARKVSEANLADIEDVNAEIKGVLPTFFHYGTVFIQTAGTAENFEFQFLPKPYKIAKLISDLHQEAIEETELKEAKEIGETILKRKQDEDITPEDVKLAAHKLSCHQKTGIAHPHGKNFARRDHYQSKPAREQQNQTSDYQQSTGWREMDNYQPSQGDKLQASQSEPVNEPEAEPKKENDDSIGHDDLKKGGKAEF